MRSRGGQAHTRRVPGEGLVIGGWIAMRQPIEILLHDWWPLRRELSDCERLCALRVELQAENGFDRVEFARSRACARAVISVARCDDLGDHRVDCALRILVGALRVGTHTGDLHASARTDRDPARAAPTRATGTIPVDARMLDAEVLSILALGFVLGLRHALDVDHLAAVATVLTQRPSWRASGTIGFSWGLGHTVVLLLVGGVVLVLRVPIPDPFALAAEFGVGLMLVLLGGMLGVRLVRERWHVHSHDHAGERHVHLHTHARVEDHGHVHGWRDSVRPFFIGGAHGLAGSAALLWVVLSSSRSVWEGLAYIAVFGVGSILGMMLVGIGVSLPVLWSWNLGGPIFRTVQGLASLGSVAVGLTMMFQIAIGT